MRFFGTLNCAATVAFLASPVFLFLHVSVFDHSPSVRQRGWSLLFIILIAAWLLTRRVLISRMPANEDEYQSGQVLVALANCAWSLTLLTIWNAEVGAGFFAFILGVPSSIVISIIGLLKIEQSMLQRPEKADSSVPHMTGKAEKWETAIGLILSAGALVYFFMLSRAEQDQIDQGKIACEQKCSAGGYKSYHYTPTARPGECLCSPAKVVR